MGALDMLTENLVVKLRLVVYCVLVFFSFFIFVGVGVFKDKLGGYCGLYVYSVATFPPPVSNCNYPMAIAIIFQLMYTLARIVILMLLVLGKFTTDMFMFSNIMELVYVLLDAIACILTFIGACILSAGQNASYKQCDSCKTALDVALAGAWISTILWVVICAVGIIYVLRAGKVPFIKSGGAGTSAGAGTTSASVPPQETPPNFEPKY